MKAMTHLDDDEFDPILKQMLKAYAQNTLQRDPEAEKRTREKFMLELDDVFLGAAVPDSTPRDTQTIPMGWASGIYQLKEYLAMTFAQRSVSTILMSILILVVFLFGGSGITAYAAGAALPGDALYPIKTSLENTRASLTPDQAAQARLYLNLRGLGSMRSRRLSGMAAHLILPMAPVNLSRIFKRPWIPYKVYREQILLRQLP